MATLKVRLFASFRDGRFKERQWSYVDGITVGSILEALNINKKDVGILLVNSRHVDMDCRLKEGDTLSIFPVIGGG
ncbi:MAG TPA: MoaD/ThiS family protein [Thermodesulfobacteriota bacterium]|nr:MoaD/ThiS family protein [Thermodesulfobacteriota bacterium]